MIQNQGKFVISCIVSFSPDSETRPHPSTTTTRVQMANNALRSSILICSPTIPAASNHRISTIRCGSRGHRGPLLKGRILSTEAIQAIQSLKRSYRTNPTSLPTHLLSRLIKSDLIATFNELLRQDHYTLALEVFSTIKSEYQVDLIMYADLVLALAKKGLTEEIDGLIGELEKQGDLRCDESKGLLKLVKAVIGADRRESTVKIYGMIKRSGWDSISFEGNEYLGKVLSKGLRRFGERELADEVGEKLERLYKGTSGKTRI